MDLMNKKFKINKDDSQYLTKFQVKKAQFLFENDYFIWNEAEMYLRFHDFFTNSSDSDLLYEKVCKATRVVFKMIHDVHFSSEKSNAAHLKFYEVLDAWGALHLYIKKFDCFPSEFICWFKSIYEIYQSNDQNISYETVLRLFLIAGSNEKSAMSAFNIMTARKKLKLNFDRVLFLLKQLVISNDVGNFCHDLVPKLKNYLLFDKTDKPPDQVLRNYDYELNDIYSNLSDWNTNLQSSKVKSKEEKKIRKVAEFDNFNLEILSQKLNFPEKEFYFNKNSSSAQNIKTSFSDPSAKNSFKLSEFKREFKNQSKSANNSNVVRLKSEIGMSESGSNLTDKKSACWSSSFSENEFKIEKKNSKKSSKNRSKYNFKQQAEVLSNFQKTTNSKINFLKKNNSTESDLANARKDSKSSHSMYENQFKRRSDSSSMSENFYENTLVSSSPQDNEIKNFSALSQSKQEKILQSILNEISSLNQRVDSKSREKLRHSRSFKLTNSSLNTLDDADSEQDMAEFYSQSDFKETDFEENLWPDQKKIKYFSNYNKYFDSENNESLNRQAFYLDQDWSLSQNSNTFNFSVNEQRIINEVLKKLRPIVEKCVRREVRKYFDKSKIFNRYDSSLTKIGDF